MRKALRCGAVFGVSVIMAGSPAAVTVAAAKDPAGIIGTVDMGTNSLLSAAVYDEHGQVVRHLYELAPRTGVVPLSWDGKDDRGDRVPANQHYNWRAITSRATGTYDGEVGDRGKAQPGYAFEATDHPGRITSVAFGPEGDVYLGSAPGEESGAHNDVYRIPQANLDSGKRTWGTGGWQLRGHAIAVDNDYAYVAAHVQTGPSEQKEYGVFRVNSATGQRADWTGIGRTNILISNWAPGTMPVTGMAVDGTHLWVISAAENQLEVFTKADGKPAPLFNGSNQLTLTNPRAIATAGTDRFWIITDNRAVRYFYNTATQTMTPEAETPVLADPYGIALAGSTLYVSEVRTGQVHRYDVSGVDGPVEQTPAWFGNMPAGGRVTDDRFGWNYDNLSEVPGGAAPIAVSPDGSTLAAADIWNGRTMFYDARTGAPRPARLEGLNSPTPDVDPTLGQDRLFSMGREYHVDYGAADPDHGHPWRLKNNWWPADNVDGRYDPFGAVVRKLSNGNEYLYVFVAARCSVGTINDPDGCRAPAGSLPFGGLLIYRLHTNGPDDGMKPAAQIRLDSPYGVAWTLTTNTNGDNELDVTGGTDTTESSDQAGYLLGNPSAWVDGEGTIWMANALKTSPHQRGVGKLELLHGFDQHANPVYELSDFAIAAPVEGDPATGTAPQQGTQVAYDVVNDRLFTETDAAEFDVTTNFGGTGVMMRDFRTGEQSLFSGYSRFDGPRYSWRDTVTGLAVDSSGGFFYSGGNSGEGQRISMYTWDGLPVARAVSPLPTYAPGLLDYGLSLTTFTHTNGMHYAYAEDNGYGMNTRYAFANVETVQRAGSDPTTGNESGEFWWPGTPTEDELVAWWKVDSGRHNNAAGRYVGDSSGGNRWGVVEPAEHPLAWWRPEDGVRNGAITFDGTRVNAVHFRKNTWSREPDWMIDNPAYESEMSFASWIRTTGSGVVAGYQDRATIEGDVTVPPPDTSVPLVYVGQDGRLYGGALAAPAQGCAPQAVSPSPVNDGQWHHVALAASPTGQTLYLDGNPVAPPACGMVHGNLGFSVLGKGYTTKGDTVWPSTPGGYFDFVGSLDDIRVYSKTLSEADVEALATTPEPSGPLAHWTFDETQGTTAADVSDHGKDVEVAGGTWQAGRLDGALSFNGGTWVSLPGELTDRAPMTFATWVRTTQGGVVLGEQRGKYPVDEVQGWHGIGPTSHQSLMIDPNDGTVRSTLLNQALGGPGRSPDLRDGNWHHIAVTGSIQMRSDGPYFTVVLYVDGTAIHTPPPDQLGMFAADRPNIQLGVGRSAGQDWKFYSGLLDDVRVYPRALTPVEVNTLAHPN